MTTNKQKQSIKAYQKFGWEITEEWTSANKTWMARWDDTNNKWENIYINGQGKTKLAKEPGESITTVYEKYLLSK